MRIRLKKESGNVGDVMFTCIGMLAMTALMMAYMGSAGLIFKKRQFPNWQGNIF